MKQGNTKLMFPFAQIKTDAWCIDCGDVGWLDTHGRCHSCATKREAELQRIGDDIGKSIRAGLGLDPKKIRR